ncbi:MAG: DNA-protecting protein DprA [Chitinivibrionales bacterium]|nr:DNA-protecting protein DprA [Chitinivibrionales bacterium]
MPLPWIALNSVKGLGPVRIKNLLEKYGSPEHVFKTSQTQLQQETGLSKAIASQIHNPNLFAEAEKQVELSRRLDVTILTLDNDDYPPLLKEIFAPPPVLYVKGSPDAFTHHAVGVVGTRRASQYGKNATSHIVKGLVRSNLVIVSGLALGIDTTAHQTCLENNGKTVAVFGCGLDTIYPATNRKLAERILENGALVSEFPLGSSPESFNFPRRNRIISGLSAGVLVVEAGEKSGGLITAHYALQQGRDVFAVAGSIFSPQSVGTHKLIKSGAVPVRNAREIVETIQAIDHLKTPHFVEAPKPKVALELLSEKEKKVFEMLSSLPQRIDQLTEKTGLALTDLLGLLLNMELKGLIQQVSGQQFIRA